MRQDEFGLPVPADFDDVPQRGKRVTTGRMALLFLVIAMAGLVAILAEHGPRLRDELARFTRDDPRSIIRRIRRDLTRGKFDDALKESDRLVRLQPAVGHRIRGDILSFMGRPAEALGDYTKAIQLDQADSSLYQRRASVFRKLGQSTEAIQDLSSAIGLEPERASLYVFRADLLANVNEFDKSIGDYSRAIELDPAEATAYNNRAYTRAMARVDLEAAFADVQRALELEPDRAAFLDTRGFLHYLLGRHDEALADFNAILEHLDRFEQDELAHDQLNVIYHHRSLARRSLGDVKGAAEDQALAVRLGFQEAAEIQPSQLPAEPPNDNSR